MSRTHVTKGAGALGTIYDRLRKRSLRKRDSSIFPGYGPTPHWAYVAGVKDALKAVEDGQRQARDTLRRTSSGRGY